MIAMVSLSLAPKAEAGTMIGNAADAKTAFKNPLRELIPMMDSLVKNTLVIKAKYLATDDERNTENYYKLRLPCPVSYTMITLKTEWYE